MKTFTLATMLAASAEAKLELSAIVEGSWFTKAVTLTNVGCESASIQKYSLKMWHNGNDDNTEPTYEYKFFNEVEGKPEGNLPLMLNSGESITICNSQCDSVVLEEWNRKFNEGEITEAKRDKGVAKCSSEFREKCNAEGALTAFTYKINFNGDDRIELHEDDHRLEFFQQVDHEDMTCFKLMSAENEEKNEWHCEQTAENAEFPASKLPANCAMPLDKLTQKSAGFHIGMFSSECNPKQCDEWSCSQWCECWQNPYVPAIFDSVQYGAALSQVCPAEGPACEC